MVSGRGCLVTVCNCLGLKILFIDRVVIGWVREVGGCGFREIFSGFCLDGWVE
jgi:hypothetical protein